MGTLKSKRIVMLMGGLAAGLLAVLLVRPWVFQVKGADHRESPVVHEDPAADIADVFAFVNPKDPTKVVFAMTVNPFSVPAVSRSYSFSPGVLYQFKIDNDGNAREDLVIQARFEGFESAPDPRCSTGAGGQFVTVRGPARPPRTGDRSEEIERGSPQVTGCSNTILGPSPEGLRIFAGLRDDPFATDVSQVFRILTNKQDVFREVTSPALGPLRGRSLRGDGTSGVDGFGGFNASTLVVEVPKTLVQGTATRTGTYLQNATTIGVWGTTSRHKSTKRSPTGDISDRGSFIQIERMGHQLFATVFIPGGMRDVFNRAIPEDDVKNFSQFVPDALTTTDTDGTGNTIAGRATVLNAVGVTALPHGAPLLLPPTFPNTAPDLLRKALLPDVLRLNLALPPDDLAIGANGLQNGRRPGDDVTDVVLRLARQLADVKFPDGSKLPGSGPLGRRKALDCKTLPSCPDRRVLVVLQGTDFIKPDADVLDLSQSWNDRALAADFPFFAPPHPLPGESGTAGFPPQQ